MPSIYRVRAIWTGFVGAPGYSNFSFQGLSDATTRNAAGARVRTLFDNLKAGLSSAWSVSVQPEVQEFDLNTGLLLGSATMTTIPAPVVGTAGAVAYAGGSGYCITWNTDLVVDGRRVRGRTFFVPALNIFDTDGTINSASLTLIRTGADAFVTAAGNPASIWHRQFNTGHPPVQISGASSPITSYTLKDQASQLRTRRL